jgi:hypothetical protein
MDQRAKGVEKARELLRTARHAAMATVNTDGSPHNTPFMWLHDTGLTRIYWGSHSESQHSRNILRTGQLFVVVYSAFDQGGLYIRAEAGHPLEGVELDEALEIHNAFRASENKNELPLSYYSGGSPQRMWAADVTGLWVNDVVRDDEGHVTKDYRLEITAADLLP